MAAVRHRRHHHIQAPKPTWMAIGGTPPAAAGRKLAGHAAYSPLLLPPPSAWREDKKRKTGDVGGAPASPRIGCMGQIKGGRGCSSVRGPAAARGLVESEHAGGGSLAGLVMGLFGRRRESKSTRACSRVRDVPSGSSSSSSSSSSSGSIRSARPPASVRLFDPPLPVPRPPTMDNNAPSLWERRRGGGKAIDGLRLSA